MIDSRFYEKREFVTIGRICEILSIDIPPNCPPLKRVINCSAIDEATQADVTFYHNTKYKDQITKTNAFACVIAGEHSHLLPHTTISLIVDEPYWANALILREFYSIRVGGQRHISPRAHISKTAVIGGGCHISDFAVIEDDVLIGEGTFIGSNSTILRGVEIGENSHIESNVTIGFAVIGKGAYIKSGARIGQQGFGFSVGKRGITDVLQVGRVIIGEDVQIGANCTIDRGSSADSKIGNHVRIDNLVHLAHNVEIDDYCVIAAQTGIAGSSSIGKGSMLGGQVGIVGHIHIGNGVQVAAQSGVVRDVPPRSRIAGTPAVNISNWHRQTIIIQKLARRERE